MIALRLVRLIEAHSEELARGLTHKLAHNPKCAELIRKVPAEELRERAYQVYHNLNDWLSTTTEKTIEERYLTLGMRRAEQGVPFSHFYWAITATKEHLWEFVEREGLLEKAVDLNASMELLRQLDTFFDRALYYAATGYERVHSPLYTVLGR